MSIGRTYRRPPITEALIDIRVDESRGVPAAESLRALLDGESNYPVREELRTVSTTLKVDASSHAADASATSKSDGFVGTSADKRNVFQCRYNGMTYSRLAPYEGWAPFRAEAERLWSKYKDATKSNGISRVAIRTINRIDLPLPFADFNQYLLTFPQIAAGLPQSLDGFLMRFQSGYNDLKSHILVTEAIVPSPSPDVASVVLDIDIFRTSELPQTDAAMWELLELLRIRKDEAFEACITDETRKLFD